MPKPLLLLIAMFVLGAGVFLSLRGSQARTSAVLPVSSPTNEAPKDFDRNVKPILEARCQPCHFPGGKMHDKLPFDKPDTITKLGPKLFTRIKKEEEQRVIREFLDASKSQSK